MESYRELIVWQKGVDLVEEIYILTSLFPSDERFGLISQIRRCAVSIPANIAEGYARKSRKEYFYFVSVSYASGAELETHLIVAKRLQMAPSKSFDKSDRMVQEVMRILNGLRRSLDSKS